MALVTELELPQFDYLDPMLRGERFHERMRELRAQGWLAGSPLGCFVLDREGVDFFLKSKKLKFPGALVVELFGVTEGPLHEEVTRNILCIDGADHRRLRSLVNPSLTARSVERYRPAIQGFLEQLWQAVAASGRCEFIADFAKPYPALTIATVMGAPLSDAERLYDWSNWIQKQFAQDVLAERPRIEQAVLEFYEYAHGLLDDRRKDPGDDLISLLIAAEEDGDRLSDDELVNLVLNILVGGVDTTQSQLAHAVRLLVDLAIDATRMQHQSRGEAAHAGADDDHFHDASPYPYRGPSCRVSTGGRNRRRAEGLAAMRNRTQRRGWVKHVSSPLAGEG